MSLPHQVLIVSKPLVPPWSDSGKNLARDIVAAGQRYRYRVLATPEAQPPGPQATVEPIYRSGGSYGAGWRQNLPVFRRLLRPDQIPLYHFFFAPNRVTSLAARAILSLKRRLTVQTICSIPASFEGCGRLLFADRTVVLSRDTRTRLQAQTDKPVVHIPPCVPLGPPISKERKLAARAQLGLPPDRPVVLFAGDYEFSNAAANCMAALPGLLTRCDCDFLFAVRLKREASRGAEAAIREQVAQGGLSERVHFANEVRDMEALAAAVTVNLLPADSLYAKMDIPLVLLESLREGVPVVVGDQGPPAELLDRDVGFAVPPGDSEALAAAVVRLVQEPALRQAKGEAGRALVRERYAPATTAAAYEALYDELMEAWKRA